MPELDDEELEEEIIEPEELLLVDVDEVVLGTQVGIPLYVLAPVVKLTS